jgi:outer membrane receptor protein involved in Fe transport
MKWAYQYNQGIRDNGNGQVQTPGFPDHRLRIQGHLAYRRTHLRWSAQETSGWDQFSNGGTLGRLVGLSVYDLSFGQDIRFKRQRFSLSLSVLNLFDAAYAYQPHMPMPGRNYRLRLVYRISHKNNPK